MWSNLYQINNLLLQQTVQSKGRSMGWALSNGNLSAQNCVRAL